MFSTINNQGNTVKDTKMALFIRMTQMKGNSQGEWNHQTLEVLYVGHGNQIHANVLTIILVSCIKIKPFCLLLPAVLFLAVGMIEMLDISK